MWNISLQRHAYYSSKIHNTAPPKLHFLKHCCLKCVLETTQSMSCFVGEESNLWANQLAKPCFLTMRIKTVIITAETQALATLLFTTKIGKQERSLCSVQLHNPRGKTERVPTHNTKKLLRSLAHRGSTGTWSLSFLAAKGTMFPKSRTEGSRLSDKCSPAHNPFLQAFNIGQWFSFFASLIYCLSLQPRMSTPREENHVIIHVSSWPSSKLDIKHKYL